MKSEFAWGRLRPSILVLLCAHIAASCISLIYATDSFPGIVAFEQPQIPAAILSTSLFAVVALLFASCQFSFGYIVGFYFYTMILGYLWLANFSLLSYNHQLATASIFLSALAFLAPALFITTSINRRFELSIQTFDALLWLILVFAAGVVAVGALHNFKPVDLSEMYKFREQLEFPALLRYAIGGTSNALLPFAFACFVARRRYWAAGIASLLLLLFYPVTLTKLTLFGAVLALSWLSCPKSSKPESRSSCRCFYQCWPGRQ